MSPILFMVLVLLYPMNSSPSQTSDCQQLREKCISAANVCESVCTSCEDVCGISDPGNCAREDSVSCSKIIQLFADQFPEFKDCIYTTDDHSLQMLLGRQCLNNKRKSQPSSVMDSQLKFLQQTKSKEIARAGMVEKDCSFAKELCQADASCFMLYKHFQRVCRAEVAKCSLPAEGEQCFNAWKRLRKTVLGDCMCPEPMHKRCSKIWQNIFNNTCLQYTQEYQASLTTKEAHAEKRTQGTDADHMKMKSQWKLSALSNYEYKNLQSCFRVNVECINDDICNKQLSLYLQVCHRNGTFCDVNRCQRSQRFFYENMPSNVAQMLTFCDCMQSDENCHISKELLHGMPCAVRVDPTPSCLSIIHTCQDNRLCWGKYEAFTSKCLNSVTPACLSDKSCLQSLDTHDLTCSDSAECRHAYVNMWGTPLRVECTCDSLTTPFEQLACRLFHHMLHSKACFNQISGRKADDLHSSYLDLPGKILPATGMQAFYGDTIYIFVYSSCIILILGIVLLALFKTRPCKTVYQTKVPSPAHLSESLMTPEQPWSNCVESGLPGSR